MSIALWCLFIAALLHVLSKMPLAKAQNECEQGYDNNNPRAQQDSLQGWGQRALAAHENQIESFPLFAAGVLVALFMQVSQGLVDQLAMAYVVARIAYLVLYLKDIATLRSVAWGVGFFSSLALLCSPAWG